MAHGAKRLATQANASLSITENPQGVILGMR